MKIRSIPVFFSLSVLICKPLFANITSALSPSMSVSNHFPAVSHTGFSFSNKKKTLIFRSLFNLKKTKAGVNFRTKQEATLHFAPQNINTNSAAQTFTIRGSSLTGSVTVTTTAPFTLSKDSVYYRTSIAFSLEELAANKKIYVKFNPTIAGDFSASITNSSEGADTKILSLSGTGIDPNSTTNNNQLIATNLITPNGDGKNDTWIIKNIDYYPKNTVKVFDQTGRIVYSKQGYTNDWNGTYNNAPLSQGTYLYVVEMGPGLGILKGYITIIRD